MREPAQHDYNRPHVWFSSGQKSNEGDRSRGAVVQPICISLLALRNAFCTLCSLSDWPYEPGFPTLWMTLREANKPGPANAGGDLSIVSSIDERCVARVPQKMRRCR